MFALIGFFALQNKIPVIVMIDTFAKADTSHDEHFKTRYFQCLVKNLAAFFIPLLMLCKSIFKHHNSNLRYIYVLWNLIP